MIYKIFYYMMLVGYLGVSIQAPNLRARLIGVVLLIANALIFYRG